MGRSREPSVHTLDEAQLAALASPVCLELVESLRVHGPASVRELGEALGRPHRSLYYHARRLLDVGLIELVEHRATARQPEAVYGLVARTLRVDPRLSRPAHRRQVQRLVRRRLRRVERDHAAALEDPATVREGRARELLLRTATGRLRPRALARLNRLLLEACRLVQDESDEQGGRRVDLTVVLTPRSDARD